MSEFDARHYWERRLEETYAINGVGYEGLGTALNAWMYRVRRHVFLRALRPRLDSGRPPRVLDIGSGTGFYVDRWHELGVSKLTGSDITTTAVQRLSERYPDDEFVRFDVGEPDPPLEEESFDAISAMDVLFHIVDDNRFLQAFRTVASLLVPGGVFVFSENFLRGDALRGHNQVSRPLRDIEEAVVAAGLQPVERRPMFALLNAPVDSRSRLLHASWQVFASTAVRSDAAAGALAALAYPLELALVSTLREGPSTEIMICRRPPSP